jgi:hypothetical protein
MPGETVPYIICQRRSLEAQQQDGTPKIKQEGSTAVAAAVGTPDAHPGASPVDDAAGPSSSTPEAAVPTGAGVSSNGTDIKEEQQQQPAAEGTGGGAVVKAEPGKGPGSSKASKGGGGGGFAEKAFHPEELREDPTLVVDREYYLGQQVHPVVARLCAPIEGTDPARLAECLGLDQTRFHGAAAGGSSMAANLREEALQVGVGCRRFSACRQRYWA